MKRNVKSALVFLLTAGLAFGGPVTGEAKAKKPSLVKKVTVNIGKKKKITVKKVKPKKTVWTLNKAGKKKVSLSKKKKNSVTVKGKKAGKATLTAKIKVGKKIYKKKVKITVKKASTATAKPIATAVPGKQTDSNRKDNDVPQSASPVVSPVTGTFSKDNNTPVWIYDNLDTKSNYKLTVGEESYDIAASDIANVLNADVDLATLYQGWSDISEETTKTFCGMTAVIKPAGDLWGPSAKNVVLGDKPSVISGTYTATVVRETDGTCRIAVLNSQYTAALKATLTESASEDGGSVIVLEICEADKSVPFARATLQMDRNKKMTALTVCRCNDKGEDSDGLVALQKNSDGTLRLLVNEKEAKNAGITLTRT